MLASFKPKVAGAIPARATNPHKQKDAPMALTPEPQAELHNQMALRMAALNTVALANSGMVGGNDTRQLIGDAERLLEYIRTGKPNAEA